MLFGIAQVKGHFLSDQGHIGELRLGPDRREGSGESNHHPQRCPLQRDGGL